MGYYTCYSLEWEVVEGDLLSDHTLSDEIEEYIQTNDFCLDSNVSYYQGYVSWYSHTKDLVEMSKSFPGVLFTLWGDGDEWDDRWVEYYLNGKYQYCPAKITIEYPPYDPSKLEELNL